jgi:hypothetical protein
MDGESEADCACLYHIPRKGLWTTLFCQGRVRQKSHLPKDEQLSGGQMYY